MVKFSKFLTGITDEVCRADYQSLRLQEKYIIEMAAHKAPVPGNGYLSFMAANEIELQLYLQKKETTFLTNLIDFLLFRIKRKVYKLCSKNEADIHLQITYRRPASSPLFGKPGEVSQQYKKGSLLDKDWEHEVYVAN